jgi:hypothetical protein
MFICITCALITKELLKRFGWGLHQQSECLFNFTSNKQTIHYLGRGLNNHQFFVVGVTEYF